MKIKMLENYGGVRTNERRILPGVYDSNDARLFGLTEFLLQTGKAIIVSTDEPLEVSEHQHDLPDGEPMATISHDEVMKRKGRPISSPVEDAQERLRTQYFLLTGEEADKRWGIATLEKKIKDLQ